MREYSIETHLATGGMAEIFLARETTTNRRVVIKRLLPDHARNPRSVSDFLNEAQIMRQIHHPNIAGILGFDEGPSSYIAIEYIDGFDLYCVEKALGRGSLMPMGLVARIIADAALGLHAAHSASNSAGEHLGVVHRDVSTTNIIVGRDGKSRIIDFGIAKATKADLRKTTTGIIKGKLAYLSPEQIAGLALDAQSDQFSLAVVTYELLTGANPFGAGQEYATLNNIVSGTHLPPSLLRTDLPAGLDGVFERALRKRAPERYPSCEAFRAALCEVIEPSTVSAVAEFIAAYSLVLEATMKQRNESDGVGVQPILPATIALQELAPQNSKSPWKRVMAISAAVVLFLVASGLWYAQQSSKNQQVVAPLAAPTVNPVAAPSEATSQAVVPAMAAQPKVPEPKARPIGLRPKVARPTPPTPTASKEATPDITPGTLRIVTADRSYLTVTVDGVPSGGTPFLRPIPPGEHEVFVENKQLGFSETYKVVVQAGREVPLKVTVLRSK